MFSPYKDKANTLNLEYNINKYFLMNNQGQVWGETVFPLELIASNIVLINILCNLDPIYSKSGYIQCNVNTIVDYYIIASWNHSNSKLYHDRLSRHETVLPHHVASMRWIQKETSS